MKDDGSEASGPERLRATIRYCLGPATAFLVWPGTWWGIRPFGIAPRPDRNQREWARSGGPSPEPSVRNEANGRRSFKWEASSSKPNEPCMGSSHVKLEISTWMGSNLAKRSQLA
jgi:hypothetical protein